jgi:pyrimidine-specific ribonucleoside hydrolase
MDVDTTASSAERIDEPRSGVVVREFPGCSPVLRSDLQPLADEIIAAHGLEEWRICVLTSEVHHHLGIYALVGAKMGLRAREQLRAEFGSLQVTSYAGRQPPVSCFNDGLQISTGSTLGHGNIWVANEEPARAEAHFDTGANGVKMRLKAQFEQRLRSDLARALEVHGGLTPAYFQNVRELALGYWLEWSREHIFDLQPL